MQFVYNTQSRKKEKFEPHDPKHVKMYCCGPTVYGLLHVGNFRGAIFYNLVRNWLEHSGYKVTYVYNYTDVDDKIIDRANKEGKTSSEISEFYIEQFKTDFARLGLKAHSHNPKVTEYMKPITDMVSDLIAKKKAYVVPTDGQSAEKNSGMGEVLYSVKSFDGYGKLSNRNTDELLADNSVDAGNRKQSPLDFALWKPSKPGEPFWPSPWGPGRPGWHIECSAMAKSILGEQIDIHGGGMDLIFPHHENEIAQSEGCSGHEYVKYWMHNNMLNFSGAKMSKSLGNIMPARTFMDEYNPEIFKYMMLSVHYRSVCDFGEQAISNAIQGLARIYSALAVADGYLNQAAASGQNLESIPVDAGFSKLTGAAWEKITAALNDDFATPEAFGEIFGLVRQFNGQVKKGMKVNPAILSKSLGLKKILSQFGELLSLFQQTPAEFLTTLDDMLLVRKNLKREDVDRLVAERFKVRSEKDFKKSDELRDQLLKMGIVVSDTATGSEWEVEK